MGQSSNRSWGREGAVTLLALSLVLCVGCDRGRRRAVESLNSPSAAERMRGLRVLGRSGDRDVAQYLAPLLQDSSRRVRETAAMALGQVGVGSQMPALIDRLTDRAPEVRLAAIRALAASKRPTARRALLPLLDDPSAAVRRATTRALEDLGMTARQQNEAFAAEILQTHVRGLAALQDQVRAESAKELGLSGNKAALQALLARLGEHVPAVLDQVAVALALIGGERAIKALEQLLGRKDPVAQVAAAKGAAVLPGQTAWPILARLLDSKDLLVRRGALSAAAVVQGKPPASTEQQICALLSVEDQQSAALAAQAVSAHQLDCKAAVTALLAAVAEVERAYDRKDPRVDGLWGGFKVLAALGCTQCGPLTLSLARHLCELYRYEAEKWVPEAIWKPSSERAGKRIDGPPPSGDRRRTVRWLLSRYPQDDGGGDGDPLMPPRIELRRIEELVRELAGYQGARVWLADLALTAPVGLRVAALQAIGLMRAPQVLAAEAQAPGPSASGATAPDAGRVGEAVRAGMASDSLTVRRAATRALWQLGEEGEGIAVGHLASFDDDLLADAAWALGRMRSKGAVPVLTRLLAERAESAVVVAIGRIGDNRATAALLRLLEEEHPEARVDERVELIQALGRIGDRAAAGALQDNLSHPNRSVRLAAAQALLRCGRKGSLPALDVCGGDYYQRIRKACDAAIRVIGKGAGTR